MPGIGYVDHSRPTYYMPVIGLVLLTKRMPGIGFVDDLHVSRRPTYMQLTDIVNKTYARNRFCSVKDN